VNQSKPDPRHWPAEDRAGAAPGILPVDAARFVTIRFPVRFPRILLPGLGIAALVFPAPVRAEFVLFRSIWGNAIVNTDMTPAGREHTPPTVEHPVYFLGTSLGTKLGSIPGDEEPGVKEVNAFVTKLLAKQGYLPAQPGVHEPALFIVMQWGYMKPGYDDRSWFLGYDESQDIAAGGGLAPLFTNLRSREIETIVEYSSVPIYGIIVTAFDYQTVRTPKPVIHWQTRIGLPADGKSMAAALPTMFLAGAPAFGRETTKPTLCDADTVREGHVKLGDLQFFDDTPPAKTRDSN
jgi:hypothetical protein